MQAHSSIKLSRAARELLEWTQADLAEKSGVNISTVKRYEKGERIRAEKVDAILSALQDAGIAFLGSHNRGVAIVEGVALKAAEPGASVPNIDGATKGQKPR